MAHILFVDANESALHTMRRAQEKNHRLSMVKGQWEYFQSTDWIEQVFDRTDRIVTLRITSDADLVTTAIREIHEQDPVDAVICQLEPAMEATAIACGCLSIPFTSSDGVLNARNKGRARECLTAAGLNTVDWAVVQDADSAVAEANRISYPVVIKPVGGQDSILAFRADNPEEVRSAASSIIEESGKYPEQLREQLQRGVLVEGHLHGELVSVELAFLEGKSYRFLVCGRSRAIENECIEMGAALPASLSVEQAEACYSYAERVCDALGLDLGVFHIEMILTENGPSLVEVNPRAMGGIMTTMFEQVTGKCFSDYIIDTYLRRAPSIETSWPSQTVTARKIMPKRAGKIPERLELSWLEDLIGKEILAFYNYKIVPGSEFDRQEVLARFVVMADTWNETMARADSYISRFEESLEVSLFQSTSSN